MSTERKFDLEDRTLEFAKQVRRFVRKLKLDLANVEDAKQLVRSSGSIGANYLEANDGLSKKDFLFRVKLSRKEAKESRYWLSLIETFGNEEWETERKELHQEANELMLILGAILRNSK